MAVTAGGLLVDYKSTANVTSSGAQALGSAVPVGAVLVATLEGSGTTGGSAGISDSKGNTWTALTEIINATTGGGWIKTFYTVVTNALTAADTVTGTRTTGSLLMQVRRLDGVDTGTPLDVAQTSGTGNSTHPLAASQTVSAGSLTIAAALLSQAPGTVTPDGTFTNEGSGSSTTSNVRHYASVKRSNGSAGAVQAGWVANTGLWAIAANTFRAASAATVSPTGTITLSGSSTLIEVEAIAVSGGVTISGSAVTREVEIKAATGTITLSASSTLLEVEAIAPAGGVTISGSAVVREVEIAAAAGPVTISGSAVVVIPTPATVTIEVGAWAQSWELGTALDDDDLDMIALDGAALDSFVASWSAVDMLTQPDPVVVQFAVYVPETAAGPDLADGTRVHVLVTPPGFDEAGPDYDPMLEFYGRITDGEAVPRRDGLVYSVNAVDDLAGLGDLTLGLVDYPGVTAADPDPVHPETHNDRVYRIKDELADQGVTLEVTNYTDDEADALPPFAGNEAAWLAFYEAHLPIPSIATGAFYPAYPERPANGIPALEMLKQITEPGCGWIRPWPDFKSSLGGGPNLSDWRDVGWTDLFQLYDQPRATPWGRVYYQPYFAAGVDDDDQAVIRELWSTPRVNNNAGLPLKVSTAGGVLSLTPKADAGAVPDTSRDGAWIPGDAIPRDGITWRVDQGAYPNRITLAGTWIDFDGPTVGGSYYWYVSRWFQAPEHVEDDAGAFDPRRVRDKGLDTDYLTPEGYDSTAATANPLYNSGDWIGFTHLGFWSDSVPRYLVDGVEIRCNAIANPLQWPRLFPDPRRSEMNGGHLGRFVFLYDLRPAWNPRRQSHYYGQLIGATMTIEAGRIRLNASLQQRRSGPNGPVGTLPGYMTSDDITSRIAQECNGQTPTPALKWSDTPVGSTIGDLTALDTDPALTALDFWLTTAT